MVVEAGQESEGVLRKNYSEIIARMLQQLVLESGLYLCTYSRIPIHR